MQRRNMFVGLTKLLMVTNVRECGKPDVNIMGKGGLITTILIARKLLLGPFCENHKKHVKYMHRKMQKVIILEFLTKITESANI